MKCYEQTHCSEKKRKDCYVWNSLHQQPGAIENAKCWILKGAYLPENRALLKSCLACTYYAALNRTSSIIADTQHDFVRITCEGILNNERSKALLEAWGPIAGQDKKFFMLDLSHVNSIYSCGLGVIVKLHKEVQERGGMLAIVGASGYVLATFESTKLSRLLTIVKDASEARALFERLVRREEEKAALKSSPPPAPAKVLACWEYWRNHNPRNATNCDECFRKIQRVSQPCWIVEGSIEGVAFQYVNEECESCSYFIEYGRQRPALTDPAAGPQGRATAP